MANGEANSDKTAEGVSDDRHRCSLLAPDELGESIGKPTRSGGRRQRT
jgi:hypothetical protein